MLLRLESADSRPLHEQLAAGIRRAVADGHWRPGDRLPPARDLAEQLDVNPNTVLRAFRQLRDEQLLEFRRGRGVTVAPRSPGAAAVKEAVHGLIALAAHHGYTRQELITMIEEAP
ncbi:GntR family transcriptional regulator [Stackebrandtia albiflava]